MSWTIASKEGRGKPVFFDGGYMWSIPPLFCRKMRPRLPAHPLWMANRLMAALADADEVALTLPVGICVVNIQRQLRPALNVVNVMDQICTSIPALGFAELTFVVV